MALRNLLVRVGADLSGLQRGMKQAQTDMNGFGKRIKSTMGGIKGQIAAALSGLAIGATIKAATEDAAKFEALMGTLSSTLGNSMTDFVKWQNTVGRSLGYSKLQSAELANTLSLNFKQIATSQQDLTDKTTKMMETAAVIANKRGMAMTEVSDRIRSAMNQEADGADELGVNVRVSAIQQSEAYKQMANGQPWSELSTNMQKAILYHHILQSVSTNLGDTLQNNTAMKMAVFTATLNDTKLALGQAFLPILNTVLPVLTAFMNKIGSALSFVAAFTRALFGTSSTAGIKQQTKATQAQASAVTGLGKATKEAGKAAKKAGKDAKGSVAGFDEINQLVDATASTAGGSGGGGGGGAVEGPAVPSFTPDAGDSTGYFEKIGQKAKELAAKFKTFFAPVSEAWGRLKQSASDLWNSPAMVKIREWFKASWLSGVEGAFLKIAGVLDILAGALDIVNGVLNGDWKKAWDGVGKILFGFYDIVTGVIQPLFPALANKMKEFGDKFRQKWDELKNINYRELFTKIETYFNDLRTKIQQKWDEVKTSTLNALNNMKNDVRTKANEAWNNFKAPFEGAYSWFKTNVVDRISKAFSGIKDAFDGSISNGFKKVYNTAVGWINGMIGDINKIKIKGVWDGVNIPKIPALAKGGITNGPTLALIGDNPGGREVVSPLDDLQDIVASAVGTAVAQAMQFSKSSSSGGDILLNIDGRTFARIVKPFLDNENQRIGNNVRLNPI